jgi:hypothetical protein
VDFRIIGSVALFSAHADRVEAGLGTRSPCHPPASSVARYANVGQRERDRSERLGEHRPGELASHVTMGHLAPGCDCASR